MTSLTVFKCFLAAMTVALVAGDASKSSIMNLEDFSEDMEQHLAKFTLPRHPRNVSNKAWTNSREYVKKAMEIIGLEVELQCFNTTVDFITENVLEEEGCNIIGQITGPSSKNLIVVGAHYDSPGLRVNHQPLRENGAGIAQMLAVAKAFVESVRWKGYTTNYTTIFVAFDLNTQQQIPKSPGHPGSYFFVKNWLTPLLQKQRRTLGASYILDSIITFNTAENTQTLTADFKVVFPDAFERIVNGSMKGNFLAGIANEDSQDLVKDFAAFYRRDRRVRPDRFQEMVAGSSGFGDGTTLNMVNHQASFHFWGNKPSMPSLLLTDTASYRAIPEEQVCEGVGCDDFKLLATKKNLEFLHHSYEALARLLLHKQTTKTGLKDDDDDSAATSVNMGTSSVLSLTLTAVLARFMAQY